MHIMQAAKKMPYFTLRDQIASKPSNFLETIHKNVHIIQVQDNLRPRYFMVHGKKYHCFIFMFPIFLSFRHFRKIGNSVSQLLNFRYFCFNGLQSIILNMKSVVHTDFDSFYCLHCWHTHLFQKFTFELIK